MSPISRTSWPLAPYTRSCQASRPSAGRRRRTVWRPQPGPSAARGSGRRRSTCGRRRSWPGGAPRSARACRRSGRRGPWRAAPRSRRRGARGARSGGRAPRPSRSRASRGRRRSPARTRCVERSSSVSSMRSTSRPPARRVKAQLKSAVRAPPMCRKPVGLGREAGADARHGGRGYQPRRRAGPSVAVEVPPSVCYSNSSGKSPSFLAFLGSRDHEAAARSPDRESDSVPLRDGAGLVARRPARRGTAFPREPSAARSRSSCCAHRMGEDVYLEGSIRGQRSSSNAAAASRAIVTRSHEPFRLVLEPAGSRVPADPEAAEALARDGLCLGEEPETGWFRGEEIDLGAFVREAIALSLPVQPLCREDCPGLCPALWGRAARGARAAARRESRSRPSRCWARSASGRVEGGADGGTQGQDLAVEARQAALAPRARAGPAQLVPAVPRAEIARTASAGTAAAIAAARSSRPTRSDAPVLALIFPGQGSQEVGMGRDVCDASPAAREVFEAADDALSLPLSRLCFEGPEEELLRTEIQQPAILTTCIALLRALEERVARRAGLRRGAQPRRVHRAGRERLARLRRRGAHGARARPLHAGGRAGAAGRDGGGARRGRERGGARPAAWRPRRPGAW